MEPKAIEVSCILITVINDTDKIPGPLDKSPKSPSKKAKAGNGPVFPNLPTPMPAESMKRGRPTKATKAGGKKVSAAAKDEEDAEEDVTAGVKEEDAEVNSDAA